NLFAGWRDDPVLDRPGFIVAFGDPGERADLRTVQWGQLVPRAWERDEMPGFLIVVVLLFCKQGRIVDLEGDDLIHPLHDHPGYILCLRSQHPLPTRHVGAPSTTNTLLDVKAASNTSGCAYCHPRRNSGTENPRNVFRNSQAPAPLSEPAPPAGLPVGLARRA